MRSESSRFGVVEHTESDIVEVDGGLLGFADSTRFVSVPVPGAEGWLWLQSVDDPELAFLVISVFAFFPDYDIELPDIDADAIDLTTVVDAEVYALVTVRRDADGAVTSMTANLLGPLVLNRRTMRARQVVLADSSYTTREPLAA
ncbi:MAG: flagellar assembly protein FliW [Acidimicrobiales bacterium]